ncbi:hypothetical protein AB0K60_18270 [Thermopolyspora sp. NPDC052614]|uniref:hypothetical protein n=1 Tax=Thermopolyspora sp. NPDC052614 TaxID=3155682 RepID=UPI00342501D0
MPSPLQYGDPPQLGPFVIQARLQTMPAGFVYLGQAQDGRAVSIAVLTRGAALDAAARDRFVGAIKEASAGGVRGWVARARGRSALAAPDAPPILDSDVGRAPWVAVPYRPGGPGAERYLEPVYVTGTFIGEAHGPDFVPYWMGDRAPAVPAPAGPGLPATEPRRSVVLASVVLALLVLILILLAWLLLVRNEEAASPTRPLPATVFIPTPPPVPTTEPPVRPSPSPSPGDTGRGTPGPEDGQDPSGAI